MAVVMAAVFVEAGPVERSAMAEHLLADGARRETGLLVALWRPLALAVFAAWVMVVGSHHEPWFDEAQAWLIARDNDLWPMIAHVVRYEGTPGLWHILLWCAIRAGLPYAKIYLLPAICTIAGAAVVLWRALFPPVLRIAMLGSYFFGYQFSVLARSYCLDLLLVPLTAVFFARRVEQPLRYALVVGLIANANTHGFLVAAVLGVELSWRMWQAGALRQPCALLALALAGGLGLFALWVAWQPADNGFLQPDTTRNLIAEIGGFLQPDTTRNLIAEIGIYLFNAFIDRISIWSGLQPSGLDFFCGVILSVLLQRPIFRLIMAGRNRALALAIVGMLLGFSVAVYAVR